MAKRTLTILAFSVSFTLAVIVAVALTASVGATLISMAGLNAWVSYIVGAMFGLLSIAFGVTVFEVVICLPRTLRFQKSVVPTEESPTPEDT